MMRSLLCIVLAFSHAAAQAQQLASIQENDLKRYADFLQLTPEQETIAQALHEEYTEEFKTYYLPRLAIYYKHWDSTHGNQGPHGGYPPGNEAMLLHDELMLLCEDLDFIEAGLFGEIEHILTPEQLELMPQVRLLRQREIWRPGTGELPGANVDLVLILLGHRNFAALQHAIDTLLEEFHGPYVDALRESITNSSRSYPEWYDAIRLLEPEILRSQNEGRDPNPEIMREGVRLAEAAARTRVPAKLALVDVNRRLLARIHEVLPADVAAEIDGLYHQIAYPKIFPDPASAERLYASGWLTRRSNPCSANRSRRSGHASARSTRG